MYYWLRIFFCLLFFTQIIQAEESEPSDPVNIELFAEEDSIQAGRPFWVALRLAIDEHWHIYWKNPGEVGIATTVEWNLPEGFHAGTIEWPFPKRLVLDDFIGYGYEGEVYLLAQIIPPAIFSNDAKLTLGAQIKWVVCSDSQCQPGEKEISIELPKTINVPKQNQQVMTHFTEARAKLPQKNWTIRAERKSPLIELTLQPPLNFTNDMTQVYFCPENHQLIDHQVDALLNQRQVTSLPYSVILKESENLKQRPTWLKGVLVFQTTSPQETQALEIDIPISSNQAQKNELIGMTDQQIKNPTDESVIPDSFDPTIQQQLPVSNEFVSSFGFALLLAFLGGMILNLMPCVLPVISFKILGFAKMSGRSRAETLKHGLVFSSGVLISFWILTIILLTLQAYGHAVGWGFQLQEPIFVALLAAILFVLGLSSLGLFEIGTAFTNWAGQVQSKVSSDGMLCSFLSGILATTVATPCTGPFLGSAVGFAMTLSAPLAMLIFTFLGLGMAFPYLILSAYPSLLRFLPKPGNWMIVFKEIMAFFMFATVLWLSWVFGAQTNTLALFLLLVSFFFLTLGSWIYGKWGTPIYSIRTRTLATVLALACLFMAGHSILHSTSSWVREFDEPLTFSENQNGWQKFSPEKLAELRKKGIPVFIDFTAKWCLICQANHFILSTDEVEEKMRELGVIKMKADWTKNDPVITQELRKFGRSSVPLYVLYGNEEKIPPQILPQVLTPDIMLRYLESMNSNAINKT